MVERDRFSRHQLRPVGPQDQPRRQWHVDTDSGAASHLDRQFLEQLPRQRVLWRFEFFDLPARQSSLPSRKIAPATTSRSLAGASLIAP